MQLYQCHALTIWTLSTTSPSRADAQGAAAVGVGLYLFGGASSGGADATTLYISPEAAATFKKVRVTVATAASVTATPT